MPLDDNEVHSWTSVLDDHLSNGKTLASIAAGNNGEADQTLGLNRVQVPADCVNALTVGAVNKSGKVWARAPYSAIGPGRSPGIVKPDVVGFGGSDDEPYLVLDGGAALKFVSTCGTSFATPHVLRTAIGLRAHFGQLLNPLAIKALLVHCADPRSHPQHEVGWGRVPEILDDLVTCPDGVVRVVYQGELTASKYLRAALPLPASALHGNVSITATRFVTRRQSVRPIQATTRVEASKCSFVQTRPRGSGVQCMPRRQAFSGPANCIPAKTSCGETRTNGKHVFTRG